MIVSEWILIVLGIFGHVAVFGMVYGIIFQRRYPSILRSLIAKHDGDEEIKVLDGEYGYRMVKTEDSAWWTTFWLSWWAGFFWPITVFLVWPGMIFAAIGKGLVKARFLQ